ncbi:SAM-dependent methyltransferase [Ancylobacter mangrovi]|uniref:SAM-dependent methyltransferase n=1 Tax=Ancylobacter mangrovi TaxID=2972472 RepID=UPI002162C479|nr:SAM-dependent methyltransferase [Ancylobacter mangrovi]MCS0501074.1 SAM-dependent methyltransferase [Ancylobacter mangrovi]
MVRLNEIRRAEVAIDPPPATDAGLVYIGRIATPWSSRLETPRLGRLDGPLCRIEVFAPWRAALKGIEAYERIEVLFWMHLSRRDLVLQSPADDGTAHGTFALRTPARPNPIGTTIARLVRVEPDGILLVRGLDCIDGTPLLDLKPDRTLFTPLAREQAGDRQTGHDDVSDGPEETPGG